MNTPRDEHDPLDAYREASAKDAGRPGAGTRKAILENAAAAARARAPAANDSRYIWHGVAGVAVLGIGMLLWRQVDHRMPGEPTVLAVEQLAEEESAAGSIAPQAAPDAADAQRREQAPRAAAAPLPPPPPPAAPVQSPRELSAELSAPAVANAHLSASGLAADRLGKQSPRAEDGPEAEALLRLHFPVQYTSDQPHTVWLVRDGTGNILRSGELAAGTTLGDLRSDIENALGAGRFLRPWRIHTLINARGQEIQLAIAQTP